MPTRAQLLCSSPMCITRVHAPGYCQDCSAKRLKQIDSRRGNSAQRGYGRNWRRARRAFLTEHPLCRECEDEGRVTLATVVDHIVPHKGNPHLFWDVENWQPLCKRHHDRKTVREDGGFGRGRGI